MYKFILSLIVCCVLGVGRIYLLLTQPLTINAPYTFTISQGDPLIKVAYALENQGITAYPRLLIYYGKLTHNDTKIYAGEYNLTPKDNLKTLLTKITSGDVIQYSFTIIEGSRFINTLEALAKHPKIASTLTPADLPIVMQLLNAPEANPEGLFLPETYFFTANTKDLDLLKRAYHAMQDKVHGLWKHKDSNLPVSSIYEALILASIVEKETHLKDELPLVSGVLQRRLQKNMRLQADPTVIYGLNKAQDTNLTKKDLLTPSAYNTYLIFGLPPTPIATPSINAIYAVLHPAPGDSLYFVANGAGGHTFTNNLKEHAKAVAVWKNKN